MRRFIRCCPLMLVCLLFIGSIAAVGYVSLLLPDKLVLTRSLLIIAGGVTAAAGLILCAVSGRGEGRAALIFFGAAIAVGCVIGSLYFGDYRNRIVQRFSGSDRSVTAVVGRVRYSSASYMIFDAQLSSIDGESCSLSATVKVRGAPGLRVGERFGMHADIAETEPYDGTALSLMYSASEGRFLTLSTDSLSIYGREPSGSLTARFARLRERVGQTLSIRLGDGAGLCRALLLGDRSELGDSISDDFSALGISHIVAVSGLHLGIITAVVSFLLRRLHVPNAPSIIVTAVFALLFAALTGFSSSVLRSALMLMIASSARLGGRSGHMPTSLASAVALIILFRPCAVLDVGLVLSFSSTFGIAVIGAPLCRRISERISRYTHDIRERFYSRSPVCDARCDLRACCRYGGVCARLGYYRCLGKSPDCAARFSLFRLFIAVFDSRHRPLFAARRASAVTLALCTAAVIICACALCRVGRGKYFKFCFPPCLRMRGTCL